MDNEIPKHKKKKNKTIKKSDHKHDYQNVGVMNNFFIRGYFVGSNPERLYSVSFLQKCSVCEKENTEHLWRVSKEELDNYIEKYGLIERDF